MTIKMTDYYKSETSEFVLAAYIDTQNEIITSCVRAINENEKRISTANAKREAYRAALLKLDPNSKVCT